MRRPLFLWALGLLGVAFLLEVGGGFLLTPSAPELGELERVAADHIDDEDERNQAIQATEDLDRPPGFGIRSLALVDAVLLLSLVLLAMGMAVDHEVQGRLTGVVSLVGGFVILLLALIQLAKAAIGLTHMLGLLLSSPFGTLAYVAVYGFFDRVSAAVLLSTVLACKVGAVALAVTAYPRFVREKGLVLLTATSIGTLLLVSFLHGLVPRMFVSIFDAVAAIIVSVVAAVWVVVLILGSLPAVVRALRVRRS